ncbi:universal stress protein [Mesorhizobium sp.]|uniref:universal stress protein n=1 Tax=Mesorhizobium sp. TaxID=1871066 RepID=UPI00338D52A2
MPSANPSACCQAPMRCTSSWSIRWRTSTATGAEPGADVAAYLARHGVNVTVDRLPSLDHSVVDVLRRHALDIAADLMVMGAYGHSRLRERIFGGVTVSMLEDPSMPILMAR